MLNIKIESKEYSSKSEAKPILHRLDYLLPRKTNDRRWFVNSILKGKKIRTESSLKPDKVKEEDVEQEKSKTADIKKDIYHKKRKYQRKQAESLDLIISRPGQQLGKMYQRIVVRKKGKIITQILYLKTETNYLQSKTEQLRHIGN